jgi:hypothetical protein
MQTKEMHLSYRCSNFLFNLENELDIMMNAPREYLPFAIGITKTVAIVTSVLYTDVPRFARPKIS